jgi:hypothetical protein
MTAVSLDHLTNTHRVDAVSAILSLSKITLSTLLLPPISSVMATSFTFSISEVTSSAIYAIENHPFCRSKA